MGNLDLLVIALGLSLDAFAVAVATGFSVRALRLRDALWMAIFFGGFQALMPVLGWLAGHQLRALISGVDHWVAFCLLAFVGGKMIYESLALTAEERMTEPPGLVLLLTLALATSLDALAVGFSLAALRVEIALPALVVGVVTFGMTLLGVALGRRFGHFFESKIEAAGGVVLILIGAKILWEHLSG